MKVSLLYENIVQVINVIGHSIFLYVLTVMYDAALTVSCTVL